MDPHQDDGRKDQCVWNVLKKDGWCEIERQKINIGVLQMITTERNLLKTIKQRKFGTLDMWKCRTDS